MAPISPPLLALSCRPDASGSPMLTSSTCTPASKLARASWYCLAGCPPLLPPEVPPINVLRLSPVKAGLRRMPLSPMPGSLAWTDVDGESRDLALSRRHVLRLLIEERRDASHRNPTVDGARPAGLLLQVLLAITLGDEVLGWRAELFGEGHRDRFSTAVRERKIVFIRADRVGVAFDQEYLTRIARNGAVDALGNHRELLHLFR